jgi:homocitrate synthase
LNNPSTYEILNPADFGLTRYVHFASRLTGWNAIKSRASQLNIDMTDEECKQCTQKIKLLADIRPIAVDDADSIIRAFHRSIKQGKAAPELEQLLPNITEAEKKALAAQNSQKEAKSRPLDDAEGIPAKKAKIAA